MLICVVRRIGKSPMPPGESQDVSMNPMPYGGSVTIASILLAASLGSASRQSACWMRHRGARRQSPLRLGDMLGWAEGLPWRRVLNVLAFQPIWPSA
jgi:hypothetical protein